MSEDYGTKTDSLSEVKRPEPNEEAQNISLEIYDSTGKKVGVIDTQILPRKMTEEETEKCFDKAYEELVNIVKAENETLDCIYKDINIPDSLSDGIVSLTMYSSDYSLIDYDGTVYNDSFQKGEYKEVKLNYIMSYEEYARKGEIAVTVRAVSDILEEGGNYDLKTIKKQVDNALLNEPEAYTARLPTDIAQGGMYYKYAKQKNSAGAYIMLIVAVIFLVIYSKRAKKSKLKKERIKELQYDYAEIISKLTLLLGAGMTIRKAWQKMVEDYLAKKAEDGIIKVVYEEMYITDCNIKAGISEYSAYEQFGQRCQTREYLKLASLLQTNLKRGTKELRQLLYQESYDAFEQRKNLAKQKGEQATTKLLIPMIMLLLIVMVIVMLPAVFSFNV